MAIYSIKDLEKLSGIKAHTLRIWEKRYGILMPKRTETNIRYYSDEDLISLLSISLLNRNGIKISKISKMTNEEISKEVSTFTEVNLEFEYQLDALTLSMVEMDDFKFDKIISMNIEQLGFERTMLEVINPFLGKLSLMWATGSISPGQEHFFSSLIKRKVIVEIDKLNYELGEESNLFLLFLPEGEYDELILLFISYLLRSRKNRVIYLGQNVPLENLESIYQLKKPNYLLTILSPTYRKWNPEQYAEKIAEQFPRTQILLTGYQVVKKPFELPGNVKILESLQTTIDFLNKLDSFGNIAP